MAKAGVQKGKPNLATSHFRLEGHRRRWQKDSLEAGATAVRGSDAVEETQLLQSRHLTQSTGETYPPPPPACPGTSLSVSHWPLAPGGETQGGAGGCRGYSSLRGSSRGEAAMDLGCRIGLPGSAPQPTMDKS